MIVPSRDYFVRDIVRYNINVSFWTFVFYLLARWANGASIVASPTCKIGSPGRRAMVIAHPCLIKHTSSPNC
jgi:hypothetical protein